VFQKNDEFNFINLLFALLPIYLFEKHFEQYICNTEISYTE